MGEKEPTLHEMMVKHLTQSITLVIALSWNDAIKDAISHLPYLKTFGMFVYAILLTVIGLMFIRLLNKTSSLADGALQTFSKRE
jgi:hypothetical protein